VSGYDPSQGRCAWGRGCRRGGGGASRQGSAVGRWARARRSVPGRMRWGKTVRAEPTVPTGRRHGSCRRAGRRVRPIRSDAVEPAPFHRGEGGTAVRPGWRAGHRVVPGGAPWERTTVCVSSGTGTASSPAHGGGCGRARRPKPVPFRGYGQLRPDSYATANDRTCPGSESGPALPSRGVEPVTFGQLALFDGGCGLYQRWGRLPPLPAPVRDNLKTVSTRFTLGNVHRLLTLPHDGTPPGAGEGPRRLLPARPSPAVSEWRRALRGAQIRGTVDPAHRVEVPRQPPPGAETPACEQRKESNGTTG